MAPKPKKENLYKPRGFPTTANVYGNLTRAWMKGRTPSQHLVITAFEGLGSPQTHQYLRTHQKRQPNHQSYQPKLQAKITGDWRLLFRPRHHAKTGEWGRAKIIRPAEV